MNRKSLVAVSAIALALAILVATSAVLAHAKGVSSEESVPRGLLASSERGAKLLPWLRWLWPAKPLKPPVEVSEEYRERVLEIIRRDPDTAKLLEEGYNVTHVRPIIKAYVGADGSVTLRADQALVVLRKDRSLALALVDLREGRVVRIAIISATLIEK